MRVHLDVPARAAYALFADRDEIQALNSDIEAARVVGRTRSGAVDLYSEIRVCVLWLCRSVRETQHMAFTPTADGGEVLARILPRGGDFRAGHARWVFRRAGGGTSLQMTAEFVPAFRVPPVIGPWLIKRWLRGEVARTAVNLERLSARGASSSHARPAR